MIAATCASVRDLYDQFYRPIRLRTRSENTRRLYEFSMARFDEFLGRRALLTDFDETTVCRFLEWRRTSGVAASTVERDRYNLLALWRYGNRRKLIDTWPEIEPEVIPERAVMAWTETEVHKLLDACKLAEGKIGRRPASTWWQVLHMLAWDTGERIAALLGIRWDGVDLQGGSVVCRAETRKGGRQDRVYKLHPDTVAILRIMPRDQDVILAWPYSKTYLWQRYTKLLEKAGLPSGRASKFHRLRRSVASHYEAAGGNATELWPDVGRTRNRLTSPQKCGQDNFGRTLDGRAAGRNCSATVRERSRNATLTSA